MLALLNLTDTVSMNYFFCQTETEKKTCIKEAIVCVVVEEYL